MKHPKRNSPERCSCPTLRTFYQFLLLQFPVWTWMPRIPANIHFIISNVNQCRCCVSSSANLDVLERVDLWLRGAEDALRSGLSADLHQVQQPLPIFVPLGPLNVERGFDGRRQGLPQVVYLMNQHGWRHEGRTKCSVISNVQTTFILKDISNNMCEAFLNSE